MPAQNLKNVNPVFMETLKAAQKFAAAEAGMWLRLARQRLLGSVCVPCVWLLIYKFVPAAAEAGKALSDVLMKLSQTHVGDIGSSSLRAAKIFLTFSR